MDTEEKFYGWRNVALLTVIGCVCIGFTMNCLSQYIVPVCDQMGFSRMEFGLISTMSSAASFFAAMFLGKIYRASGGGKRFILLGVICAALHLALFSAAGSLAVFYISGICLGAASCCLTAAGVALFISEWFIEKKNFALGIIAAGLGVGGMLGNLLLGSLIQRFGWQRAAWIILGLLVVVALPSVLLLADRPEKYGQKPLGDPGVEKDTKAVSAADTVQRETKKGRVGIALCGMFLCSLATCAIVMNQAAMLTDAGSVLPAATVISVGYGICVMAKLFLGGFIDRAGIEKGVAIACVGLVAAPLCIIFSGKALLISLLFALTFAFGQTIMTVCLAALVDKVVGAENTGKMIGVFSAVATIGTLLSSFAIPMLFDRSGSYRLPLMLASCCAAMGFICLWIAMKTKKDK